MRLKIALLLLLLPLAAPATEPERLLADPALEARAERLFRELRCMVCQAQSVAESQVEVAQSIRETVRERIASGEGDAAIKDFLVSRYGDQVLMRPKFRRSTLLLWAGPLAMLAIGAYLSLRLFKKNAS